LIDAFKQLIIKQTWRERCLRSPGNHEEPLNHHVHAVRSGELLQIDKHPRGKWKRWRETSEVQGEAAPGDAQVGILLASDSKEVQVEQESDVASNARGNGRTESY
jgi:hypothetical protein